VSLNKSSIFLVLIISLSTLAISEQQVFATKSNTEDNSTGTVDRGTAPDVANEGTTPGGGTAPAGNEGTTSPQGNGVATNGTDTGSTPDGATPAGNEGSNGTGPAPNGTGGLNVSGNCNAVALSNAANNSSSASSAAVTCNNSVVNKNIYQQRITQTLPQIQSAIANKGPMIQSDSKESDQTM
jgi:hypothetical protein